MKSTVKLMSASGKSHCEYSMAHEEFDAVAWIDLGESLGRYLACTHCADLHIKRGGKVLLDVRKGDTFTFCNRHGVDKIECADLPHHGAIGIIEHVPMEGKQYGK